MRTGNRIIFAAMALFLLPLAMSGQSAQEIDTTSFNALEYSMQKRYRPQNEAFVADTFMDNTFIRGGIGTCGLFRNSISGYSSGPCVSFSVGKMFTPLNAVSIDGTFSEFRRSADGVRVWRAGVGASHHFDWTSYFFGYSPSRVFNISSIEGAEAGLVRTSGTYSAALMVNFGIDFRARIAHETDLFFTPRLMLGNDRMDGTSSPDRCHLGYGFNFGVHKYFNRHTSAAPEGFGVWFVRDASISFSGGIQFQLADITGETVGYFPSARESVNISYTRLLSGPFSLRLSGFYGGDIWKGFNDGRQLKCHYAGVREELMFETLYWRRRSSQVFSMPVFLGPEAGLIWKRDDGYTIRRLYLGLTGGIQFRFNLAPHFGLFLEPRMSLVPYSWKSRSGNVLVKSYTTWYDTLFSLQAGVVVPL